MIFNRMCRDYKIERSYSKFKRRYTNKRRTVRKFTSRRKQITGRTEEATKMQQEF